MLPVLEEKMTRQLIIAATTLGVGLTASAGTIGGKVSGVNGPSAVYLEAIAGKTFTPPTANPLIDQRRIMFRPRVLVVQQGATVEFQNSDPVAHNVFWTNINGNKKLGHSLGTWPQGQKRTFKFEDLGVVPLLCVVHPEMAAFIVVVPTPYFALTDKEGNFKIENVPDGSYTVTAWHEGAKNQSKPVTVKGGQGNADFTLSK